MYVLENKVGDRGLEAMERNLETVILQVRFRLPPPYSTLRVCSAPFLCANRGRFAKTGSGKT